MSSPHVSGTVQMVTSKEVQWTRSQDIQMFICSYVRIYRSPNVLMSKCLQEWMSRYPNYSLSRSRPIPAGLHLHASLRHILGEVPEASHAGLSDVVDADVDTVVVQLREQRTLGATSTYCPLRSEGCTSTSTTLTSPFYSSAP